MSCKTLSKGKPQFSQDKQGSSPQTGVGHLLLMAKRLNVRVLSYVPILTSWNSCIPIQCFDFNNRYAVRLKIQFLL